MSPAVPHFKVFKGVVLCAMMLASCADQTLNPPHGLASKMNESIVALSQRNRLDALNTLSQQMIVKGTFATADEFLNSFTGLFEEEGILYFQLGGIRKPSRQYTAEITVRRIPGVDSFTGDGAAWWPDRGSEANAHLIKLFGGMFSQELYTEQMNGP